MTIKIHMAMQDADDFDARARNLIKQNVGSGGIFLVAGTNILACAPQPRFS
jgi:hypothetical protein